MLVDKSKGGLPPIANWGEGQGPRAQTKEATPLLAFVYLAVMIISWAANWPLMKLALGQVPPLVFVLFRLIGSLALIAPALVVARQPLLPARGKRSGLFWIGQLQVAGFLICSIIDLAIRSGRKGDRARLYDAALGDPASNAADHCLKGSMAFLAITFSNMRNFAPIATSAFSAMA